MEHMKKSRSLTCSGCMICPAVLYVAAIRSCTPTFQGSKETAEFTLSFPEDVVYTTAVEARQAKGTIHIRLKGNA